MEKIAEMSGYPRKARYREAKKAMAAAGTRQKWYGFSHASVAFPKHQNTLQDTENGRQRSTLFSRMLVASGK